MIVLVSEQHLRVLDALCGKKCHKGGIGIPFEEIGKVGFADAHLCSHFFQCQRFGAILRYEQTGFCHSLHELLLGGGLHRGRSLLLFQAKATGQFKEAKEQRIHPNLFECVLREGSIGKGFQKQDHTIESMPWMFPTGPDEYLHLLEDVDRDRFAVHLDVFNWMTSAQRYFYNEEFVDECFEKLGPYIKSCHLKDVRLEEAYTLHLTETSPGNGGVDLLHLIRTAERYDPDMPFIIEHLDSDEAYLQSVAYVQMLAK